MPTIGNHVDAIFIPQSVNTSTKLRINDGDGPISIGDITTGTPTTDSGIMFDLGTLGDVKSALFTEVDGKILSYGVNVNQIDTAYDSARSGGIFRLDTRNGIESGGLLDKHCFVVKGRGEGETAEFDALGIDFNTGDTYINIDKGSLGIGTNSINYDVDIVGDVNFTGNLYQNGVLFQPGGGGGADSVIAAFTFTIASSTNTISGTSDEEDLATAIVEGNKYEILTVGTTDYTLIGAGDNNIGTQFTATDVGTGTGTVKRVLVYDANYLDNLEVYLNGVRLLEGSGADYVASTGTSIVFADNLSIGDSVYVKSYIAASVGTFYTKQETDSRIQTELSTFSFNPVGADGALQYNNNGSVGGALRVQYDDTNDRLNVNTAIQFRDASGSTLNNNFSRVYQNSSSSADYGLTLRHYQGDTQYPDAGIILGGAGNSEGLISFYRNTSGTNDLSMVITDTGNVGIGAATPSTKLVVQGNILVDNSVDTFIGYAGTAGPTFTNLMTNGHADFHLGVNLELDNSHNLVTVNSHANITGSGVVLGGNAYPNGINSINFFSNTSGTATAGTTYAPSTAKMVLASTGNVGIGTTNPTAKFMVWNSAGATAAQLISSPASSPANFDTSQFFALQRNAGVSGLTYSANDTRLLCATVTPDDEVVWRGNRLGLLATDYLAFRTGGSTEKMRITSTGNVGIGDNNPQNKLKVRQSAVANAPSRSAALYLENNANCELQMVGNSANNIQLRMGTSNNSFAGALDYRLVDNRLDIYTNSTRQVVIDSSGNVGIGTPSPATKLHVYGASGDITSTVQSGSTVGRFLTNSNGTYVGTTTDNDFTIQTNNQNRVTVKNTGNVGIGTNNPGAPLEINNAGPRIRLRDSDGTNTYSEVSASTGALYLSSRNDAANGQFIFQGTGGGTADEHMRIDTSGRLLIGTNSGFQIENTITPRVISANNTGSGNCADLFVGSFQNAGGSGRARVSGKLFLAHSRSGTSGSIGGLVGNNDRLGEVRFIGDDGAQFLTAAEIIAEVDGPPGTNDMPGRLIFSTTADGASSPTERMRISSNGNVGINNAAANLNDNLTIGAIVNDVATQRYISIRGKTGSAASEVSGFTCLGWGGYNAASPYTTNSVTAYSAQTYSLGTNQTLTNLYGFYVSAGLNVATNSYGFYSNLAAGTGRWNFYANGTASNYFAGSALFNNSNESNIQAGTVNGKVILSSSIMYSSRSTTLAASHILFTNLNGIVGQISTNGSNTVFTTSSDYRLKENVTPMVGAADRVKALKPCRFNFIADATKTVDGFLAHEAQEVVPESVTGTKDEMEDIGTLTEWDGTILETNTPEPDSLTWDETITDEDGNETVETRTRTWVKTGDRPVMQGIDQAKLVPLLTGALQEALAKIDDLEARLAAAGL